MAAVEIRGDLGSFALPPVSDGMRGEGGSVVGDADDEGAAILVDIVNAIGDSDTNRVSAEIVIVDATRLAFPAAAGIPEVTHEFALFDVDADDRQMAALEALTQLGEIFELEVAVGAGVRGNLLVIDAERIAHLMEQTGDGVAEFGQFLGNRGGGAA